MKKHLLQVLLIAVSICLFNSSCKKNSTDKASATKVEYKIVPPNNYFTKITYTDNTGKDVVITDPDQILQFVNGSKVISLSTKPFTAKISTEVNNTGSVAINFNLVIVVNGEAEKIVPASVPPQTSSYITSAEFTVQ